MAHFIPVDGSTGPEEAFGDLMFRFPNNCLIRFEHLGDGRQIVSRIDVVEVNFVATEIAGAIIYGDAILFSGTEL